MAWEFNEWTGARYWIESDYDPCYVYFEPGDPLPDGSFERRIMWFSYSDRSCAPNQSAARRMNRKEAVKIARMYGCTMR